MKAIVYSKYGSPDVLKLQDIPVPKPGAKEVLIKVKASSINSWDYDMLTGRPKAYQLISGIARPRYPVLGADVAGIVEAVGTKVSSFKVGDRVFGDLSNSGWGAYAEYVTANESSLAKMPEALSFVDAAALPQAGVLAWQGVYDRVKLKPKAKVLLNGAGGSVGVLALQMAKNEGADVTCVDAASKLDALKKLGADRVVDYLKTDYTEEGIQYDLVLDMVATKTMKTYKQILRPDGSYAMIGGKINSLLSAVVRGNKQSGILAHKANFHLKNLADACIEGTLKPVIDRIYPLEQTRNAFHQFASGKFVGKIVIDVSASSTTERLKS